MLLDTTPDAARMRWKILATMTGEARLLQALQLTDLVYRIAADGRRARAAESKDDWPTDAQRREPARS